MIPCPQYRVVRIQIILDGATVNVVDRHLGPQETGREGFHLTRTGAKRGLRGSMNPSLPYIKKIPGLETQSATCFHYFCQVNEKNCLFYFHFKKWVWTKLSWILCCGILYSTFRWHLGNHEDDFHHRYESCFFPRTAPKKEERDRKLLQAPLWGKPINLTCSMGSLTVKQCEGFQRTTDLPLEALGLHLWILTPSQDFRAATRKLRTLWKLTWS